jgi:alpha-L-fucosidase
MASVTRAQYAYPTDPAVLQNLNEWQDIKFGLFMHWGTYSIWDAVESWTLEPNDKGWAERPIDKNYFDYVHEYEALQTQFNPIKFDPAKWAELAEEAGMKYVVFTTKHHDGFNMFDTKQSDYKITSAKCPFHTNPNADVTKAIFNAFRERGFKIGAYYSITDWHSDYCWWRYFPPPYSGMTNYEPKKHPDRWAKFQDFIDAQLVELSSDYGRVDIFWFDGVGPGIDRERFGKDIRAKQPHTLLVFRGAEGQLENYTIAEARFPEKAPDNPWELCMPMGDWSYRTNPPLVSSREYVQMLLTAVSRGGNFLLNVGPSPEGEWHPQMIERLKDIGAWMKVNSEAIYGTKRTTPTEETKFVFTQKGATVYAAYMADEGETRIPAVIAVNSFCPAKGSKVYLLGHSSPLSWNKNGKGFVVRIPPSLQKNPPSQHAFVLKFSEGL